MLRFMFKLFPVFFAIFLEARFLGLCSVRADTVTLRQPSSDSGETVQHDTFMMLRPSSDSREPAEHDTVMMLQPSSDPPEATQDDTVVMSQPSSDPPEPAQHDTVMMLQPSSDTPEPAQHDTVMMLQLLSNPPEPAQHDTVMVLHPSSDPPEPAQHDTVMMLQLLSDPPEPAQRDTVMMLQPSSDLRETTERDKGTVLQQPSDQQQPVPHDASTMSQQASDPPEKVPHDASTMSQQASDSPGIRTVSDEPGDFQSCRKGGATVNLASPQGSLAWTGNNSAMKCSWRIDVTSLGIDGLVIQIHQVHLLRGKTAAEDDTLAVFWNQPDNSFVSRLVQGSLPVPPVLIHSRQALVKVQAFKHDRLREDERKSEAPSPGKEVSRFYLSYKGYSSHSLPPKLPNGLYNCSQPYDVPEALQCDLAEQCEQGEDEKNYNCSYLHPDCEDWIQVGNFCVKFVFPPDPLSPMAAREECGKLGRWGARLAALPDSEAKAMAAEVASLSGHQDVIVGLEKLQVRHRGLSNMYRFLWTWSFFGAVEFQGPYFGLQGPTLNCATLRVHPAPYFNPVSCSLNLRAGYACMRSKKGYIQFNHWIRPPSRFSYPPVSKPMDRIPVKQCSDGSFAPVFGHCAPSLKDSVDKPDRHLDHPRRLFECSNQRTVHYTLTCDGYDDCEDGSDETGCMLAKYILSSDQFLECKETAELILAEHRCDGKADCHDESDEQLCDTCGPGAVYISQLGCLPQAYRRFGLQKYDRPSLTSCDDAVWSMEYNDDVVRRIQANEHSTGTFRVLTLDGSGAVDISLTAERACPETHFTCPKGLCIPSFLVGNGQYDCPFPFEADERTDLHIYEKPCPGYYRCSHYPSICIHPDYVCDGVYHCPRKDDERFCNLTCPPGCTCEAWHYTCNQTFDLQQHTLIRYLDLSHVSQPVQDLQAMWNLWFLNLSSCDLNDSSLPWSLPFAFLRVLDLSFNKLTGVRSVRLDALWLTHLNLSGNPLVTQLISNYTAILVNEPSSLLSLALAGTQTQQLDQQMFSQYTSLVYLDVSENSVARFKRGVFDGLRRLKRLKADNQRLCCAYTRRHPLNQLMCEAPVDELSSCEDLLRSAFLRVTLWLQALMAVVGNVGVFIFRVFIESRLTSSSFRVLVANLCVADLLMGIYMIVIGAADARYSGQFLWEKDAWTDSRQCKAAGFLALLSSEVSAFIICLITVDRFLVLRFPFEPQIHLTSRSASLACGAAWTLGALLALVPLLPVTRHWQFYGQTGICLPLPITRQQFPGQTYSFAVFVGLNFVLFMLIGAGQACIYRAIHNTPMAGRSQRHRQDAAIARRLFLIVFTDFCCWFPVGVMGLLAARGTPIPGEVNVVTAVFVLPLNSALNPFLYTLNAARERRAKRKEARRLQTVMNKMQAELSTWPCDKVAQLVRYAQSLMRCPAGTTDSSNADTVPV